MNLSARTLLHKSNLKARLKPEGAMDITSKQEKPQQEMEADRILRKRTLELGEIGSSDEETNAKAPKMSSSEASTQRQVIDFDKLFPNWWVEDQHLETCYCDFCVMFFNKSRPSIEESVISFDVETEPEPANVSTDLEPAPKTPDAA